MSFGYRIFKYIDRVLGRKYSRCHDCGKKLTKQEIHYYGNTCEKCEKRFMKWLSKLN